MLQYVLGGIGILVVFLFFPEGRQFMQNASPETLNNLFILGLVGIGAALIHDVVQLFTRPKVVTTRTPADPDDVDDLDA